MLRSYYTKVEGRKTTILEKYSYLKATCKGLLYTFLRQMKEFS